MRMTQTQRQVVKTCVISFVAGIVLATYVSPSLPAILTALTDMLWRIALICVTLWVVRTFVAGIIIGIREGRKS